MKKTSATVQAIIDDQTFMRRLADAYRIKCNPHISHKEDLYHALYGYLPYDGPTTGVRA